MESTRNITIPAADTGPGFRLSDAIRADSLSSAPPSEFCIGILRGEGIGPEVIRVAEDVLACVARQTAHQFDMAEGGAIGCAAREACGADLSPDVEDFCEGIFAREGALLCGPGGGRFVYDLRARFDLFCKLTPVTPLPALADAGVMKAGARRDVDLVVVRENAGGLYFGEGARRGAGPEGSAHHSFSYREAEVARILEVAMVLAEGRRGKIMLALKPGGVPEISALWRECYQRLAAERRLESALMEIDNAVYQVLEKAREFDVIVAPNMFADVLSDACSLLLGSRGMSFSGNFNAQGHAVYQTGHGAAHDLAGKDEANPIGQVLSLAMLLRESFGLDREATAIESAVEQTVSAGWRTRDIAARDSKVVGTREMGSLICREVEGLLTAQRA